MPDSLLKKSEERYENEMELSLEGTQDLEQIYDSLLNMVNLTVSALEKWDEEEAKQASSYEDEIDTIKQIACEYYQYTQFKRACFECTEVKYDVDTKRIVEMNFAMQTVEDEDGNKNVIFD